MYPAQKSFIKKLLSTGASESSFALDFNFDQLLLESISDTNFRSGYSFV